MSKLRADITWKHRINSNLPVPTPIRIVNDIEDNDDDDKNDDNIEIEENVEENLEEEDEDENLADLEEELGDYLQGWSEMLEEENARSQNDDYEIDELDLYTNTMEIIHPAIDSNAKWKLESLFKNLDFPF
jgi:hypothetical protein